VSALKKLVPTPVKRLRAETVRKLGYVHGPRFMSWCRKRWVIFRNPHATIIFEGHNHLGKGFSLHLPEPGATFIVGKYNDFRNGFRCEIGGGGVVKIGDFCVFSHNTLIQCTTSIEIGNRVMFGQSSMIVDGNHRFRDLDKPMLEQGYDYKPLKLEDDVTTTTKCTIIANIGTRAFVGANSVVVHDVPPYTVVAGVPAKVRDYFGPPGQEPEGFTPRESSEEPRAPATPS